MSIAHEVRRNFEGFDFGPPCTPEDLARAELELGHPLPAVLRELYLSCDGFLGPTSARFFYPLLRRADDSSNSLVDMTRFLRGEEYFPGFWRRAVAFGDDGCGSQWGMFIDSPGEVFEWYPADGEEYTAVSRSPLDIWLKAKELYEESAHGD